MQVDVPLGSIIITPADQRRNQPNKELEEEKKRRRVANTPLGRYYFFVPVDERFVGIKPETVTKLIYLITFLGYDGVLMRTRRRQMKIQDLHDVLGVSKATVTRFWGEVSPKYLYQNDEGAVCVNASIFIRQKMKRKQYTAYQKFYVDGVRTLYKAVPVSAHRRLGHLFQLLPYINMEYNVLCWPECVEEKDPEKIRLLSIAEFCRLIGYDVRHFNELASGYREARFQAESHTEHFCVFRYERIEQKTAKIIVSPYVMYNGSDYRMVSQFLSVKNHTKRPEIPIILG